MKKKLDIDGERIRREREKRAWTQEELSERSQLAVRTLRRLEAGGGSLESIRRVAEALELEPEKALFKEKTVSKVEMPYDPIRIEVSSNLLGRDSQVFVDPLLQRMTAIRRHLAGQLGYRMPGVRFRDFRSPDSIYRLYIREVLEGEGTLPPGRLLAIGSREKLAGLAGPETKDPTYGMPGVWIEERDRPEAEARGCMVFDAVSILATHLTEVVKRNAHRLLGIEEVAGLLAELAHPHLVAEVIPGKVTMIELRSILRRLLAERVTLLDLGLILETLADHPGSVEERTECVRRALREFISRDYADDDGVIRAIPADRPDLQAFGESLGERGVHPIVLCEGDSRPALRAQFADKPYWVFLARAEIAPRYRVEWLRGAE